MTHPLLAYGYDLGGPDRWAVRETDSGHLNVPWWDGRTDFPTALRAGLLTAAGHDPNQHIRFFTLREATFGVRAVPYQTPAKSGYLLSTRATSAYTHPEPIATQSLIEAAADADERLRQACQALGLTPLQGRPTWHLCAGP